MSEPPETSTKIPQSDGPIITAAQAKQRRRTPINRRGSKGGLRGVVVEDVADLEVERPVGTDE
jgi:hypothetical protein